MKTDRFGELPPQEGKLRKQSKVAPPCFCVCLSLTCLLIQLPSKDFKIQTQNAS